MSGPIVLTGFKGSGKSTVGKVLAQKLSLSFVDTDSVIEELYKNREGESLTFRDIYKKRGAEYFKELETLAVKEALAAPDRVVSFGGGTLINADKDGFEKGDALFVHILVEKEELLKRIVKDGTPAFLEERNLRGSYESLLAEREPVYERYADITVDNTGGSVEKVAEEIVEKIKER